MKRLSSTDIGYEKNVSGPNVMSWTLAGTKTAVLEFGCNKNFCPGILLDKKRCSGNWFEGYQLFCNLQAYFLEAQRIQIVAEKQNCRWTIKTYEIEDVLKEIPGRGVTTIQRKTV